MELFDRFNIFNHFKPTNAFFFIVFTPLLYKSMASKLNRRSLENCSSSSTSNELPDISKNSVRLLIGVGIEVSPRCWQMVIFLSLIVKHWHASGQSERLYTMEAVIASKKTWKIIFFCECECADCDCDYDRDYECDCDVSCVRVIFFSYGALYCFDPQFMIYIGMFRVNCVLFFTCKMQNNEIITIKVTQCDVAWIIFVWVQTKGRGKKEENNDIGGYCSLITDRNCADIRGGNASKRVEVESIMLLCTSFNESQLASK